LKYYLSGAITHQPDFKAYFKKYEEELQYWGIDNIFNPAAVEWPQDVKWETCMKYDLKILVNCDVLVLLPNWKKSKGVKLEIHIAKALGIRVIAIRSLIKEVMYNAS
jgi:hypothetical protein